VGINYAPDWGEGQIMSIWDGDERPLRAGMTFHLVPGIYDLGRHTIVISETVHVTDDGCESRISLAIFLSPERGGGGEAAVLQSKRGRNMRTIQVQRDPEGMLVRSV
jgi:hypothetical protein